MRCPMTKCDGCGRTVTEPFHEDGWLILTDQTGAKPAALHVTYGTQDQSGGRESLFVKAAGDFCTIECFTRWLREKVEIDREERSKRRLLFEHDLAAAGGLRS